MADTDLDPGSDVPTRRAAAGPSVATTRARPRTPVPSATSAVVPSIRSTGLDRRTVPSGSAAASWSGMACMPRAGTAASPSASVRKITSNMRADVSSDGSSRIPPSRGRKNRCTTLGGEAGVGQGPGGGPVGPLEQADRGGVHEALAEQTDAGLVAQRPHVGPHRRQEGTGLAEGIGHALERGAGPHQRGRVERLEVERGEIELGGHLRVGGEQDLEAPVEPVAVDHIGAHPPADAVGRLEHPGGEPRPGGGTGGAEPGEPGAHDHHIDVVHGVVSIAVGPQPLATARNRPSDPRTSRARPTETRPPHTTFGGLGVRRPWGASGCGGPGGWRLHGRRAGTGRRRPR